MGLVVVVAGARSLGLDRIFGILMNAPAFSLTVTPALAALAAVALFSTVVARRRIRTATMALDNMTQGLSMFDGAGRLVLCNARYIEMSQLPPESFRKGTPLRELLVRRTRTGSFAGDPDQYVADALKRAAECRTEAKTFELEDGRAILFVSRPLASGGWVSTHTDVTQQRVAERERDLLRQNEDRRAVIIVPSPVFALAASARLRRSGRVLKR